MAFLSTRRGDTLIEVVFALAILASLLTAVTTGAVNSWRTSRLAGERSMATGVVEEQAEALRAYRRSMDWTTFKDGDVLNGIPSIHSYITTNQKFMMRINANKWQIQLCGIFVCSNGKYSISIAPKDVPGDLTVRSFIIQATWKSSGRNVQNSTDQVIYLGENDQ